MSAKNQIIEKPIIELSLHPFINQTYCDEVTVNGLVDSISEVGILEPIKITNQNKVVDGRHRWLAAKRAGLTTVPCQIIPDQDADQSALIIVNTFLSRRHCSPSQIAYTIAKLIPEAFEESKRRQRAALQKGNLLVSENSANEVKSVKEWSVFLGMDDEFLQQANRLRKLFGEDTVKRTLTDSEGVVEQDKTLQEFFEPRIMRRNPRPYTLGNVLTAINSILDTEKGSGNAQTHSTKDTPKKLDQFKKGLVNEIAQLDLWAQLDEKAQIKHWKFVRSKAALLPQEQCLALADYHKKLAQTLRKASKLDKQSTTSDPINAIRLDNKKLKNAKTEAGNGDVI